MELVRHYQRAMATGLCLYAVAGGLLYWRSSGDGAACGRMSDGISGETSHMIEEPTRLVAYGWSTCRELWMLGVLSQESRV